METPPKYNILNLKTHTLTPFNTTTEIVAHLETKYGNFHINEITDVLKRNNLLVLALMASYLQIRLSLSAL